MMLILWKKDECDEKEMMRVWCENFNKKKWKNEKEDKISSLWKSFKKWQKTVLLSEQQTNTTEEERKNNFVSQQQQQQVVCVRTTD